MKNTWQDVMIMALALWLLVAPFVLGYISTSPGASGTAFLFASLFILFATLDVAVPKLWEEWSNTILGLLLVVSPWAVAYQEAMLATINALIIGGLMCGLGLWTLIRGYSYHKHQMIPH